MSEYEYIRHPDDLGIDEVLFVEGDPINTVEESLERAILRIGITDRYKTSGISGDEWRFSYGLYQRRPLGWTGRLRFRQGRNPVALSD